MEFIISVYMMQVFCMESEDIQAIFGILYSFVIIFLLFGKILISLYILCICIVCYIVYRPLLEDKNV